MVIPFYFGAFVVTGTDELLSVLGVDCILLTDDIHQQLYTNNIIINKSYINIF